MKKYLPFLATVILIAAVIGYFWWQKRQVVIMPGFEALVPEMEKISCEALKDIPSVEFAPENVKQRFSECFPDRMEITIPFSSAIPNDSSAIAPSSEQGPTCEQLSAIPSVQYAPSQYQDKFTECFPERK